MSQVCPAVCPVYHVCVSHLSSHPCACIHSYVSHVHVPPHSSHCIVSPLSSLVSLPSTHVCLHLSGSSKQHGLTEEWNRYSTGVWVGVTLQTWVSNLHIQDWNCTKCFELAQHFFFLLLFWAVHYFLEVIDLAWQAVVYVMVCSPSRQG